MNTHQCSPLSQSNEKSSVCIDQFNISSPLQARLLSMGLGKGSQLDILRNRKGDIVIGNGNTRISLGRDIAQQILVNSNPH